MTAGASRVKGQRHKARVRADTLRCAVEQTLREPSAHPAGTVGIDDAAAG
jgi:hypothetical protein